MYFDQVAERQYVMRVGRGENVISAIEEFCLQEKITGAFFFGIGAVDQVELAHYDVNAQKYSTKTYNQPLEVTNVSGNIARHDDELIVHAHGTFSDTEMQCLGGHIVEMKVSGTLEIILTETSPLTKLKDDETGLKLLDLSGQI